MPKDSMEMYSDMLEKLANQYPELEEEASALSSKMMSMDEMGLEEEEEELKMPGDLEEIPADLLDEEPELGI